MLALAIARCASGCITGSPAKQRCAVQDGTSKMSKSAESDMSRINLLDDTTTIQDKLKRCKTDSYEGLEYGNPERPEATNLVTIYSLCTGVTMVSCPCLTEAVADDMSGSAAGCYACHGQICCVLGSSSVQGMKMLASARQCLRCPELLDDLQACTTLCQCKSAEPPVLQDVALQEVSSMRWGHFKSTLADAVVAHLQPIQERYHAVIQDTAYLDQVRLPPVVCTQRMEGGITPN